MLKIESQLKFLVISLSQGFKKQINLSKFDNLGKQFLFVKAKARRALYIDSLTMYLTLRKIFDKGATA